MTGSNKLPTMGINGNKGIHFKYANGYTLSVQIGPGNYCDNRDRDILDTFTEMKKGYDLPASSTAEIAVWPEGGDMIHLSEYDTVSGWFPIEQLPWLMLKVGQPDVTPDQIRELVEQVNQT